MPDFDIKQQVPASEIIQAMSNKSYKEAMMRQAQTEQLLNGMKGLAEGMVAVGTRRQKMAQAMAAADFLSKTDQGQKFLGENVVSQGPQGQPVRPMQTAQGTDVQGNLLPSPIKNKPMITRNELATAVEGLSPKDLLSHLFPSSIDQSIIQTDQQGNILSTLTRKAPKGSSISITKPQPVGLKQGVPLSSDRATLKFVEDFNKDSGVMRAKQGLDGAENVRNLAVSGNPIAAAAIPTYMARASGEVGNLSEADKAPFGGSRAILTKFEASLNQLAEGKLTEENKAFLIDLSSIMEKSANKNLDRRGIDMARQFSKVHNEKPESIYESLRPGRSFSGQPVAQEVSQPSQSAFVHLSTKELMDMRKKATAHKGQP